jgi:LuxR family maltose regulon positive regulatory protein
VFLDAGVDLMALLSHVAADTPQGRHAAAVLAAAEETQQPPRTSTSQLSQPLDDPLSERELHELRMLESDLDGPGFARELSVSVITVRTHTRHIYAKLGVTNRREAVRQAARLGLLRQPSR